MDADPWPAQRTPSQDLDPDGEEPDWEAARHGGPGQPDPRIGRSPRSGTLLAITTALVGLAAVWPIVAAAVLVLLCWAARFTDRSVTSMVVRRYANGHRRSDVPMAVAASPWHLVSSAVGTLVALLLPAVVAVASTFSAALVVVSVAGGSPRPAASAPLAAGALMGVLTAWWGPGGASLRRGARSLVRGTVRGRSASEVVVTGLLLAAAGLGIWAWLRAGVPSWWPGTPSRAAVPLAAKPLNAARHSGRRPRVTVGSMDIRDREREDDGPEDPPADHGSSGKERARRTPSAGPGRRCGAVSGPLSRCLWSTRCGARRTATPTSSS